MDESVYNLLVNFLRRENYRVNFEELRVQLLSHPSYPSLHSITGVLDHFGIENMALELPSNLDMLAELPNNFIALTKVKQYVLVKKVDDKINLLCEDGTKKELDNLDFLAIWDGVVVGIEPTNKVFRKTPLTKNMPILLFSVIALIFGTYVLLKEPSSFMLMHFILGTIGFYISILILKQELGYHSKALDKICNSNKRSSCDDVLQSNGAEIFGSIKLSDLSVVYFAGISLTWFFISLIGLKGNALAILSLIAIPITFYSIYYQSKVVKKWCPLCLGIVGVLWFQAVSIALNDYSLSYFSFKEITVLSIAFLFVSLIWVSLRPLIITSQDFKKLKIEHYKFKRNFDFFNFILDQNHFMDTSLLGIQKDEIVFGNKDASLELILVTSPGCYYCKQAHADMEKILIQNQGQIKLSIRFNIGTENHDYNGYRVATKLMEIYEDVSENECRIAIEEAYLPTANLDKWLLKWGEPNSFKYDTLLEEEKKWCNNNEINFTPAIILNGREFPKEYEFSDLSLFINDLLENCDKQLLTEETESHKIALQE